MSWNWDHLRYFLALADNRKLALAARQLDVSHTTVLRRIRTFEEELKTQLFEHSAQRYNLTKAGETLYAEASKMKMTIESVAQQIAGGDQSLYGEVAITTTDTLAYRVLPGILKELVDQYEGLNFSLKMINPLSNLREQEADIAIRTCRAPPEQLIGRKIGHLNFVACASRRYVQAHAIDRFPEDVAQHRFIVLDKSYADTPFYQWLDNRLTPDSYRTIASSFLCAFGLCQAGLGIAVLPSYLLSDIPDLVELPANTSIYSNELWILSPSELRDNERVKLARRYLFDALHDLFN